MKTLIFFLSVVATYALAFAGLVLLPEELNGWIWFQIWIVSVTILLREEIGVALDVIIYIRGDLRMKVYVFLHALAHSEFPSKDEQEEMAYLGPRNGWYLACYKGLLRVALFNMRATMSLKKRIEENH